MTFIAHLSDPHLDGSPQRLHRLHAVLAQVADLPQVDVVLVSGDIADHGEAAEYEQFFDTLPGDVPVLTVPGNHDLTAPFLAALDNKGRLASLNTTVDVPGLRLIGLDSHIDENDEGELGDAALEHAREQLASAQGPVVLALHHPPVAVGHEVMDRFGLTNAEDLADLVHTHENVIGILTGHVHSALATTYAGVPLLGAPGIVSTMRLGSKTDPIADPEAMPGLAIHTIRGSTTSTVFHYLSPSAL
ncbi:metallophosphoesterase [Curtobacterium sp. ISL-83]|uniref:metallophosphoesterase n=1 Tax=Curtobacterium sp. ISL-83 TaxID=2819145 RepID=UPI001BE757C3|nr:metallophosphoesterase [Curtobacterium sp. ISL-83]MBT2504186.1 metallophosphoesterase [Curtobacterium sp. ISL-83]